MLNLFHETKEDFTMLFDLQQCTATPAALDVLEQAGISPNDLLKRHVSGDFGKAGHYNDILPELTKEEISLQALATSDDGKLNAIAIKTGDGQIMSYYCINGEDVWVSTYLDEEGYTTILLPSDY
ncbi:hypothetical protein [Pseudanabaena sp. FACHB-2040]|uniref:hypothetical protein n=1 Tax=Pseudanabaena sp. FACHB-2040 TaxID=2692859 RepID=UPI0016896082|nr:hypothetical protein [Pseudanabaena sp. FACHB-2040]MBD2258611.1 hypothetical protein [Pseudanabaena sp. FACHB-2040]